MKIASTIVGALLGFAFIASGLLVLLKLGPQPPPPPEGSAAAHFMAAFMTTGYMSFVKVCEVMGGLLVAIPKTRRAGLLVLGPILINILAFHAFVAGGKDLLSPPLLVLCAMALFLTWVERCAFARFLINKPSDPARTSS
ncbi:MAG: hypothetical protein HYR88_14825 [Verrucomicrobia bacterium]|nr:hypothetical protein [Verrucomicrobiota bacterium]MBI3868404.1 hypothetical protein [Verrucomicrobiota bacterium]